MTVTFRVATPDDAAAVLAVTQAAFGMGPPLEPPSGAVSEMLDQVRADLVEDGGVVGEIDGTVVAALRTPRRGRAVWLRRVAVTPTLWRHSVGSRLVAWTHAHLAQHSDLHELRVGVRTARPGARRFWEELGYTPSTQHDYWQELRRDPAYAGVVATAADMRAIGSRLAALLQAGDLVVCIGGLGAGKTTFAQGVGAGLGVAGAVTSPTFVLARQHRPAATGRGLPFVHVDTYRLGAVADPLGELDSLDLDTGLEEAVTLVEWGEGLVEQLARNRVEVRMYADPSTEARTIVVDVLGPRWAGVDLRATLADAAPVTSRVH
ncbi:MAG: tRNA threonylcarbamoyladenosine biosynthesis protein TsaE [Frankiales bacterium]|jgi:tRNA threonylcarbamoyladenosine biosynthesis protein TsaE|nr:tRNA threonylcarbamoyladenosine biosynthesis protein TsaE [Frankiales bacterium]